MYILYNFIIFGLSLFGCNFSQSKKMMENNDEKQFEVQILNTKKLSRHIDEIHPALKKFKNDEAYLVIGNTGAGKSTSITYLNGGIMEERTDYNGDMYVNSKSKGMPIIASLETNPDFLYNSQTIYPQLFKGKVNFCDTPGFKDSGTLEEKITRAISVKVALEKLKIKGIIVVISKDEFKSTKGNVAKEMFKILNILLKNPSNNLKDVFFLFNKYKQDINIDKFKKNNLKSLAKSLQPGSSEKKLLEQILQSNNTFMINPLDEGISKDKILNVLNKKNGFLNSNQFNFAADELTMEHIKNWIKEAVNTCVDSWTKIQKAKKRINKENSGINKIKRRVKFEKKQNMPKVQFDIDFKGNNNDEECLFEKEESAIDDLKESLNKKIEKINNEIEKIESDKTKIPYQKKEFVSEEVSDGEEEIPMSSGEIAFHTFSGIFSFGISSIISASTGAFNKRYRKKYKTVERTKYCDIEYNSEGKQLEFPVSYTTKQKNQHPAFKTILNILKNKVSIFKSHKEVLDQNKIILENIAKMSKFTERIDTIVKCNDLIDLKRYTNKINEFIDINQKTSFIFKYKYKFEN